MNQIYYTQCPIGYGLGASNGFQIKRLSSGYPVSGDFRHFSLRVGSCRLRIANGHDGRNGMLVYELLRAASQHQAKLIERLDFALEPNSIHQIDRDRNAA